MAEPRFIIRESTGYRIHPGSARSNQAGSDTERTEVLVLDSAYCYRVVWSSWTTKNTLSKRVPYIDRRYGRARRTTRTIRWASTGFRWSRDAARKYADELASQLNAEDAVG